MAIPCSPYVAQPKIHRDADVKDQKSVPYTAMLTGNHRIAAPLT
jgi:hypothetical protein